jgi:integrase
VKVGKSINPSQPVATEAFYTSLKNAAPLLENPLFELAVDVAYGTGHRINAILNLRWDDVSFESSPDAPLGSILWRKEFDKLGYEHLVPMNPLVRAVLERALGTRSAESGSLVFPSDSDRTRPVDRHLASRWFVRAEQLSGLKHVRGTGWHCFRRGWASSRRHVPDVDVAKAGGWKDTATMKRCYQHSDSAGVLHAVNDARPITGVC